MDKHSSYLKKIVNYGKKSFITTAPDFFQRETSFFNNFGFFGFKLKK